MTDFLIQLGYGGMFIGAFVAGSVFPFSSETLLAALLLAKLDPWLLFILATTGNVLGSAFNYGVGRNCRIERIEQLLHIKREQIAKTKRFLDRHGMLTGILSIVPFLGSAVTVTLGYTHAKFWTSMLNILLAKALRYWVIIFAFDLFGLSAPASDTEPAPSDKTTTELQHDTDNQHNKELRLAHSPARHRHAS